MLKHKVISKVITTVMAVICVVSMTACGGGNQPSTGTGQSTAEKDPSAASDESSGEKVTIVYTSWGDANEKKSMEECAAGFMELHPNIEVKIIMIPNADYDAKVTSMVAANEQIDLVQLESASVAYPLAEQGKLTDLNKMYELYPIASPDDYLAVANYYNGDNLIGIYNGIENFVLYYSKAAFDKAGIPYPSADPAEAMTWDEFVDLSKKLTLDTGGNTPNDAGFDDKNIAQYGVTIGKWWGTWGNFVSSNGGYYITDDNKFGLSEPSGYEAIQKLADLTLVEKVAPTPTLEKGGGLPGVDIGLMTGKYAMAIDGQWASLNLGTSKVDYGVAPLPKMGDKCVTQAVSGMHSIMEESEHKEEAWLFLHYILDPASNLTQYKNGNLMPIKTDWLTEPDLLAQWTNNEAHPEGYEEAVIGMLLDYSVQSPTGIVKNFSKIMDLVNPALDDVWLGNKTAEEAMKAIEPKVSPLVEGKR